MNLIILTENDKISNSQYELFDDRFLHIKKILKKNVGETVQAGIVNSSIGNAKIIFESDKSIILEYFEIQKNNIPSIELDIICALPRPQTLKKILPLIATTGIRNLHLIKSNRVEKSFFHSPLVNEEEKINKYLFEGLSQGRRVHLPYVKVYKSFKKYFEEGFLEISKNSDSTTSEYIVLHPDQNNNLYDICKEKRIKKIIAAIGPEGGWIPFEIDYMSNLGFKKLSIGSSILRVENAINSIISQKELMEMIF